MVTALIVVSLLAAAFGGVCVWLALDRGRRASALAVAEREAALLSERADELSGRLEAAEALAEAEEGRANRAELARATLEEKLESLRESERAHREELERRLKGVQEQLEAVFSASAQKAVDASSKRLLELAAERFEKQHGEQSQTLKDLVGPIGETLRKTDEKLGVLEKQRVATHAALNEQIEQLKFGSERLTDQTRKLGDALRKPQVRGRYGEVQLQRVAELAGMTSYCDFALQDSRTDEGSGARLRPDMVVRLPNDREIVVDAKTNIGPYLEALEAEDAEREAACLDRFARGVLEQAKALGGKSYYAQYDGSPEFTVMFIPGDQFVDAALEREPRLIELAAEKNVLLASPSTLIGLLRAVAVGWREKSLSDAANELFALGRELHERAAVVLEHVGDVGRHLERTSKSYNKLVGSMDTRLTPTLKRFEEAGAKSAKSLPELKGVETPVRGGEGVGGSDERLLDA